MADKRLSPVTIKDGRQPVLLAVLAHPDDETFGTGGTLALYARRGVQVHLICATRGEVGEMDPELLRGYDSVGARREDELRCAADLLKLSGVHFLGYRDSGMPGSPDNRHPNALVAQPPERVAADITSIMRRLRPQVVITFDPIGGYRHPDHIFIHNATVSAFNQADEPADLPGSYNEPYQPERLYFQTISRTFLKAAVKVMPLFGRDPRKFGVNGDIDLLSLANVSFPTHARIDFTPVAAIRDQAAACHSSQGGRNMTRGVQGLLAKLFRSTETYMRAAPPPQPGEPVERDLFQGV